MAAIATYRGEPIVSPGDGPTGIAWTYRGDARGILVPRDSRIHVPEGGSAIAGTAVPVVVARAPASGGALPGVTANPDGLWFEPPGYGGLPARALGAAPAGIATLLDALAAASLAGTAVVQVHGPDTGPGTLREAVYAILAASAELTVVVGPRVHHAALPQGKAPPAVVFSFPADDPGLNLDGGDGTADASLQVDCQALAAADADAAAQAVVAAFHGLRGKVGRVVLLGCFVEDVAEAVERRADGRDEWLHRRIVQIKVRRRVPIPALPGVA